MTKKLPKHIAQMVEKNNLVVAIKTLAADANISMGEAKSIIDAYEAQLKAKQDKKVQAIANKQGVSTASQPLQPSQSLQQSSIKPHSNIDAATNNITTGLDQHLDQIGYKKPLLPYWAKRATILLLVIGLLVLIIRQLIA